MSSQKGEKPRRKMYHQTFLLLVHLPNMEWSVWEQRQEETYSRCGGF